MEHHPETPAGTFAVEERKTVRGAHSAAVRAVVEWAGSTAPAHALVGILEALYLPTAHRSAELDAVVGDGAVVADCEGVAWQFGPLTGWASKLTWHRAGERETADSGALRFPVRILQARGVVDR